MSPNDQKKMRGIPTKKRAWRMWFKYWFWFVFDCFLIWAVTTAVLYYFIFQLGNLLLKP